MYLHYACICKRWSDFLRLSNEFNDQIDFPAFGSKALYEFYKKKAAAEVAKTPL